MQISLNTGYKLQVQGKISNFTINRDHSDKKGSHLHLQIS